MTFEREARYTSKGTILSSSYSGFIYACGPRALAAMHFDRNPCHPMRMTWTAALLGVVMF